MHKTFRIIFALTAITLTVALIAAEKTGGNTGTSASLVSQGEAQLAQNDIDGAIVTLTQAVEADPSSPLAHTRLGGALLLGQQYDAAIAQFQQAIALDAENAPAFIGLGVAYLHSERLGQAKAALDEAKRLAPAKTAEIDDLIGRIEQRAASHP
jgi:tetratricopeptide (TPR) repeat protein